MFKVLVKPRLKLRSLEVLSRIEDVLIKRKKKKEQREREREREREGGGGKTNNKYCISAMNSPGS